MDVMPGILSGCSPLITVAVVALTLLGAARESHAANYRTANFVVTASSDEVARQVANCAEHWRRELAIQWFDKTLPNWYRPCPITVKVGTMGASGQTTFTFEDGEVHGWKMHVQGSLERILDSVVPHEVNHTIFASHFRRPLPRWADEGAATLFEHESEQARQMELLSEVFSTPRRIPLKNLLAIREYPTDMRDVLTLYAEGYSLARFLVDSKGQQGRQTYLQFLDDAHQIGWEQAIVKNYSFKGIDHLEHDWSNWILAGSPPIQQREENPVAIAATAPQQPAQEHLASMESPGTVVRSQSPQTEVDPAQLDSAPLFIASRVSEALPSIPRRLRVDALESRVQSEEPSSSGSRIPRPTADLSPTADGIKTTADASHYGFPEARR